MGFKHISLFSGIGGFEYAAQQMGWTNIASCEINPFGRRVLEYYWPEAYHHDDIKTLTKEKLEYEIQNRFGSKYRTGPIILTGGFPCQPFSVAGKRKGTADDRHLWPEMLRVIREISPDWIVGENVRGIVTWDGGLVFEQVQLDLEAEGYKVFPVILPACSVNAPHRRERIWFVAYKNSNSNGWGSEQRQEESGFGEFGDSGAGNNVGLRTNDEESGIVTDSSFIGCDNRSDNREKRHVQNDIGFTKEDKSEREGRISGIGKIGEIRISSDTDSKLSQRRSSKIGSNSPKRYIGASLCNNTWENFPTQSPVRYGDDGLSARLDRITFPKWRNESIKAGGNAIVPQVAMQIFKVIEQMTFNK